VNNLEGVSVHALLPCNSANGNFLTCRRSPQPVSQHSESEGTVLVSRPNCELRPFRGRGWDDEDGGKRIRIAKKAVKILWMRGRGAAPWLRYLGRYRLPRAAKDQDEYAVIIEQTTSARDARWPSMITGGRSFKMKIGKFEHLSKFQP